MESIQINVSNDCEDANYNHSSTINIAHKLSNIFTYLKYSIEKQLFKY
jgi:hypothetical protein